MYKRSIAAAALYFSVVGPVAAQAPFGSEEDVAYAATLWERLARFNLHGRTQINTVPYDGQHPHGAVLETLEGVIQVGDDVGAVIVKRNYGGEGATKASVANDRAKYLGAVTVMFRRPGYDPDNANWFWAKYLPDGSLDKNPMGVPLAGRVAKGMAEGCIACHEAAPGGDYVYNHDRYAK